MKTEEANVAREESLAEREAKKEEAEREAKKEEAEQEAKREELRHEREMLTLRIESNRARAKADESPHMESTRNVRSFIPAPPLPRFHESEGSIDVYLQRFERYAANEGK